MAVAYPASMNQPSQRFPGLDLLRSIAILLVVLEHGTYFDFGRRPNRYDAQFFLNGVELFFVLSGFLIGRILIRQMQQSNQPASQLRNFWVRRWLRTLPLYFAALLANIWLVYAGWMVGNTDTISWRFLLFLQNFRWYFNGFFMESWSLAVEEWFYLLFPIGLLLLRKIFSFPKAFLIAAAGILLFSVGYRWHISPLVTNAEQWDMLLRKLVLCRLDALMVGCLLAWGWENHATWLSRYRWPLFVTGLLVYLSVLVIPGFPNSSYFRLAYLSVNAMAIGCMLPLFASLPAIGTWPQSIIGFISKISYSMYLVHAIVLGLMLHNPMLSTGHYWLNLLLYGTATIAIASITYRCIEKPVLQYRDKHFAA